MGTTLFKIPSDLPDDALEDLERSSIAGGQDWMPFPTQVTVDEDAVMMTKSVDESGFLQAPWDVPGFGRVVTSSATLMERPNMYDMALELARGTVNRLRSQVSEWTMSGLAMDASLSDEVHQAVRSMAQTLFPGSAEEQLALCTETLTRGKQASEALVEAYVSQVFYLRHLNRAKLETYQSCRLNGWPLRGDLQKILPLAFNALSVGVPWRNIEPTRGDFRWQAMDEMVQWAERSGLQLIGGPLIDFSGFGLPDWLWGRNNNLEKLAENLCGFVDRVISRYGHRISRWQLTAGSNVGGVLGKSEEELLWLTYQIINTARGLQNEHEWIVGIAQPWGEYMAQQACNLSPFAFIDSLIRTEIKIAAIDVEMIMGVSSRGSYCRDRLDMSRILDLYAYLEIPLQVTMGYPSKADQDTNADDGLRADAGFWREKLSPQSQATWVREFASLALCKPAVVGVQWVHLNDAAPHQFPNCGLVDAQGNIKPVMDVLMELRSEHLK